MTDQRVLRAEAGYMWDYWFSNDGIVRVQLITRKLQLGIYAAVWILFFTVALVLFGGYFLMLPFSIVFVIAFYLAGGALLRRIARNRRRSLLPVTPGNAGDNKPTSVFLGWDAVTRVELRRNNVRIVVGNRIYDSRVGEEAQMNGLKDLVSSKLSDRLVVR